MPCRKLSRGFRVAGWATALALGATPGPIRAATQLYQVSGFVFQLAPAAPPFDLPISVGDPVVGRFFYDPLVPGSPSGGSCDCASYSQRNYNEMTFRIGAELIRLDEYLITVANDLPQVGGGIQDGFTLEWASGANPPPLSPLWINGQPQSHGLFSVNFLGPSWLIETPALSPPFALPSALPGALFFSHVHGEVAARILLTNLSVANHLTGDFDVNQAVDGNDVLLWQRDAGAGSSSADANGDQIVDEADLMFWQDDFGASLLPAASAAGETVPELSSLTLAGFAIAGGRALRRPPRAGSRR